MRRFLFCFIFSSATLKHTKTNFITFEVYPFQPKNKNQTHTHKQNLSTLLLFFCIFSQFQITPKRNSTHPKLTPKKKPKTKTKHTQNTISHNSFFFFFALYFYVYFCFSTTITTTNKLNFCICFGWS